MHLAITVLVVLLSIVSLVLIAVSARKENLRSLGVWAALCLAAMLVGAVGSNVFSQSVFGIFERLSTISAVVFNAVLGWYLFAGKLGKMAVAGDASTGATQ